MTYIEPEEVASLLEFKSSGKKVPEAIKKKTNSKKRRF